MIIQSIAVLANTPQTRVLCASYFLDNVGYFKRTTICEFLTFFSTTFAERTPRGVRQSIEKDDYIGHVFTNLSGLSCVIICDKEYPSRVAFGLINQVLDEITRSIGVEVLLSSKSVDFPALDVYIKKYQNPQEADSILRVQRELDDTKVVLHKTLESLLERGEKLDELITRSDQLGVQSQLFYKSSKKANSCCIIQ